MKPVHPAGHVGAVQAACGCRSGRAETPAPPPSGRSAAKASASAARIGRGGAPKPRRPVQRGGRAHHHAHRQEGVGGGMGAGQDRARRARGGSRHRRCRPRPRCRWSAPHRPAAPPRRQGSSPCCRPPRRHRQPGAHPPPRGKHRAQPPAACPGVRPAAAGGRRPSRPARTDRGSHAPVAQSSSCVPPASVGFGGDLARQRKAHVILGQHQHPRPRHHLRFVLVQPKKLRRGDARIGLPLVRSPMSGQSASNSAHSAMARWSFHRIAGRSGRSGAIQQQRRQHLPRQPDPLHRRHLARGARPQAHRDRSTPPRPTDRRAVRSSRHGGSTRRWALRGVGRRPARVLEQHRLDARGAEIDPDGQHHARPCDQQRAPSPRR